MQQYRSYVTVPNITASIVFQNTNRQKIMYVNLFCIWFCFVWLLWRIICVTKFSKHPLIRCLLECECMLSNSVAMSYLPCVTVLKCIYDDDVIFINMLSTLAFMRKHPGENQQRDILQDIPAMINHSSSSSTSAENYNKCKLNKYYMDECRRRVLHYI